METSRKVIMGTNRRKKIMRATSMGLPSYTARANGNARFTETAVNGSFRIGQPCDDMLILLLILDPDRSQDIDELIEL